MYKMVRGTTQNIAVTILNDDGTVYELQSGDKLIFGVKLNPESSEYDIKKIVEAADSNGCCVISLTPEDTEGLAFATYYFDVGLQTASGDFYMVVECDDFIVCKAITAKEAT